MSERRADLHSHTVASDGSTAPAENVRIAREAGLTAIAITDHDTVAGVAEAVEASRKQGVEVVPGVEISSVARGQDIHVLGFFVPYEDPAFREQLARLREVRHERNRMMIERLNELGIPITLEEVHAQKTGDDERNLGRPHIAQVLVAKGVVTSLEEAFEKYLGKGGLAYVTPPRISPHDAIRLIHQAGGAAVLAHPGLYEDDELVEELIRAGLDGLEVWHPDNDEDARRRYQQLAEAHGLIMTGGSDFHGWRGEEPFHAMLGSSTADAAVVDQLRQAAERHRASRGPSRG